MCRYFVTSCLYNPSLYHIIVLCLRARGSLGTSPTAASLKRYVCKIEGVEGPEKATLYLSLSEKKPVDDSVRLALRGNSGPGSYELVIFVVDKDAAEKRSKSTRNAGSNELPAWNIEERYGAPL